MAFDGCATPFPTESKKRVDYTYGLVLGVSEFRTEQGYFLGKHRGHARGLHGYGTVSGLAVSVTGSEVRVAPGLALDPQGREICVPEPQCADLEDWLARRRKDGDFSPPMGLSPPAQVRAYVVLCYRECETERVPIPAGPCLSLDRTAVPSRIQDAFELAIVETPPPQVEETAARILGDVLGHVRISAEPGALTDAGPLVAELRALLEASPPVAPGSPPQDLVLDPGHAGEILREALRVWVTEVRPQLVPEGGGCLGGPRDPECVLLAQLDFGVKDVGGVLQVDGAVAVDDSDRPIVVQTRVLQEMLAPSAGAAAPGAAEVAAPAPVPATHAASLSFPAARAIAILGSQTSPYVVGNALAGLRFFPNAAAASVAPVPPDLVPTAPLRIRLHWGISGAVPVPLFAWTVTVRFFAPGGQIGPGQTVAIPPPAAPPAANTLVVSAPVALAPVVASVPPPATAALVSVTVAVPGGLPPTATIVLYTAELQYTAGGGAP